MVEITAMYPAGIEGTTAENLKASADGENEEWADLYPHFAEIADAEGFSNIAATWRKIAAAEKGHEERFRQTLRPSSKRRSVQTRRRNRLAMSADTFITVKKPPKACPTCAHAQAYFEEMKTNY